MKCDICSAKIETTFLGKIRGTYVRDAKGKQKAACFECQRKLVTKEALLDALK
ncbi:TPA: hypothetical protein HA372_01190 [Candidatus Woesearchaeota archaeon]|nr:MAG: hypothetical protein QT04_C0060G0013 [archaeon GW2011_AR11]HIH05420.1 hypothetical protein [Candidatus Woesearchaeota archaeon]HII64816.1 hypothetical protein [Candidatus Woesearchaeota archaeon]HII66353.1 hypothetical protein [Candidatus Woesearchaeota archaeon]HIJ18285.1 hypothetical protein [Candidatus Woesearchaeota archaeon]